MKRGSAGLRSNHGFHRRTTRERRIRWSCVASGMSRARAVATMRRSAGSPWKEPGSWSTAMTTSAVSGAMRTTDGCVASRSQRRNGARRSSLPFACSICASHIQTAGRSGGSTVAISSKVSCCRRGKSSWPSSHQIQMCVSRTGLNARPRNLAQSSPTHRRGHAARRFREVGAREGTLSQYRRQLERDVPRPGRAVQFREPRHCFRALAGSASTAL